MRFATENLYDALDLTMKVYFKFFEGHASTSMIAVHHLWPRRKWRLERQPHSVAGMGRSFLHGCTAFRTHVVIGVVSVSAPHPLRRSAGKKYGKPGFFYFRSVLEMVYYSKHAP